MKHTLKEKMNLFLRRSMMKKEIKDMLCVCYHIEKWFPYDMTLKKEYINSVLNYCPTWLQKVMKDILIIEKRVDSSGEAYFVFFFKKDVKVKNLLSLIEPEDLSEDRENG